MPHAVTAQSPLPWAPQGHRSSRGTCHTSTLNEGLCLRISSTLQGRNFIPLYRCREQGLRRCRASPETQERFSEGTEACGNVGDSHTQEGSDKARGDCAWGFCEQWGVCKPGLREVSLDLLPETHVDASKLWESPASFTLIP